MKIEWNTFERIRIERRRELLEYFLGMVPDFNFSEFDSKVYESKVSEFARVGLLDYEGKWAGITVFYANNHEESTGFISLISVERSLRGLGLGKLLLVETLQVLAANGMHRVVLEVSSSNLRAQQFYKAHGFTFERSRKTSMFFSRAL